MNPDKKVRIGCFSAFWGDTFTGAHQLVKQTSHPINYLVGDYLSEVTMGILARMKHKNPEGGFVSEFGSHVWKPLMKILLEKNIRVITNAGGMNPVKCKKVIEEAAREAGIPIPKVAAVVGDDLAPKLKQLFGQGGLKPFEAEGEEEDVLKILTKKKLMSANAYLGAEPILEALNQGAQVIVTGRCSDSALVLAPLMYEFGWKNTDYDLLASGSVAGHIIECGCQATGGNFTDWELSFSGNTDEKGENVSWDNVGFPIVECFPDGSFIVTKPEYTGGVVNKGTVAEQLVYEIGDPSSYILPDVIVDFRSITMTELPPLIKNGSGRVLVRNAKGRAPTPFYKVSLTYFDGMKVSAELVVGGADAAKKARAVAFAILKKTTNMLKEMSMKPFEAHNVELLGAEHTYGPHSRTENTSREVVLRITVVHSNSKALELFAKEIAPAATGMAPGLTGAADGRPRPSPLLGHAACLVEKKHLPVVIFYGEPNEKKVITISCPPEPTQYSQHLGNESLPVATMNNLSGIECYAPLITLCYARSGDKGDIANIGIIAREPEYYPFLKKVLTSDAVRDYMKHVIGGKVTRYELPGIYAFNFVCTSSLGGGGLRSLNIDRQGKCYGQMLLDFKVKVPIEWYNKSLFNQKSKL